MDDPCGPGANAEAEIQFVNRLGNIACRKFCSGDLKGRWTSAGGLPICSDESTLIVRVKAEGEAGIQWANGQTGKQGCMN